MQQTGTNNSWYYDLSKDSKVRFCLWVLQWDGLQVPPFETHPEGTARLQELGLTPQNWTAWFHKVITTQDSRLLGCKNEAKKQERIDRLLNNTRLFYEMINSSWFPPWKKRLEFDEVKERSHLEKSLENSIREYQKAAERAAPFCRRCDPPHVWQGNREIQELLWHLWGEYTAPPSSQDITFQDVSRKDLDVFQRNRHFNLWRFLTAIPRSIASVYARDRFLKKVKAYSDRVPSLKIFVINYPAVQTVLCPPKSAVMSFSPTEPNTPQYYQRLLGVVKDLYEANL